MYMSRIAKDVGERHFEQILLRESYRPKGVPRMELFEGRLGEILAGGIRYLVRRNEPALKEIARLDGCYVIKTDVAAAAASAETFHTRYKDLGLVEQAFRNSQTGHLELRSVYIRTPAHPGAHVFVVMLAYLLRCALARTWAGLDLTVEAGLRQLTTLYATEVHFSAGKVCLSVPTPRESVATLFATAEVTLPTALPRNHTPVAMKQKLAPHRKLR